MTAQKTKPRIPKHLRGVWEQINDAVRALGSSASTPVAQIEEGASYSIIEPMKAVLRLDDEGYSIIRLTREPTVRDGEWAFWGIRENSDTIYSHCYEYSASKRNGRIDIGRSSHLVTEIPLMLLSVTNKKTKGMGKIIICPYPNMLRDLAMRSRYTGEAYSEAGLTYCRVYYRQVGEDDYGSVEVM